jgi:hypothetical protein
MATRLALRMEELVATNQTAFSRKFCLSQRLGDAVSKRKNPMIFLNLEVTKAFDTISWGFLLNMLRSRGFAARWRSWISTLILTAEISIRGEWKRQRQIQACEGIETRQSSIASALRPGNGHTVESPGESHLVGIVGKFGR